MPETALHFSDVTFGFTKKKPLFDKLSCFLSNESGSGKIIALMGPSGVGKTTFCDLAMGTRKPQTGTVRFKPEGANIAVIPQKGVIFDELSVKENISCLKYSKTLGGTFRPEKVDHAVQSLGLVSVVQHGISAASLSGGEAQRVMLARIQTVACDVLILDEPCSFLDNRVKDSFLSALRRTVDELGLLALMVTHVWEEARLIADDVIFFHQTDGKPVTLHRSSVGDAQNRPPTVDALFAIHWPDCTVVDSPQPVFNAVGSELPLPPASRYVGMFRKFRSQLVGNEWSRRTWLEADQLPSVVAARKSHHRGDNLDLADVVPVFYDDNGVAL